MATHSSILAWRIPWTEEPGRSRKESDTTEQLTIHTHTAHVYNMECCKSMESQRVWHDWAAKHTAITWLCLILGTGGVNAYVTVLWWRKAWSSLWCCVIRPPSWVKTPWIPSPMPLRRGLCQAVQQRGSGACIIHVHHYSDTFWTFRSATSWCERLTFSQGSFLRSCWEAGGANHVILPLRYFNEMSAQGLRPRTVSSPIPYTPSPSSSRPISPGEYVFSAASATHFCCIY